MMSLAPSWWAHGIHIVYIIDACTLPVFSQKLPHLHAMLGILYILCMQLGFWDKRNAIKAILSETDIKKQFQTKAQVCYRRANHNEREIEEHDLSKVLPLKAQPCLISTGVPFGHATHWNLVLWRIKSRVSATINTGQTHSKHCRALVVCLQIKGW